LTQGLGQYARLRHARSMAMFYKDEESDHRNNGIALD
jgi:hypothetical protein